MDYLSSGYTAPVRWRTQGDDTIMIRWYRAAPGALVYQKPHAFGSSVWDDDTFPENEGVGTLQVRYDWNPSGKPLHDGRGPVANEEYLLLGVPPNAECLAPCFDADLGLRARIYGPAPSGAGRLGFRARYLATGNFAFCTLGFQATYLVNGQKRRGSLGFQGVYEANPLAFRGLMGLQGAWTPGPHGFIPLQNPTPAGWIVPAGVYGVLAEALGPTGSGDPLVIGASGGGGGGGYSATWLPVTPGQTLTYITQENPGTVSWVSTTGVAPLTPSQGALANGGTNGSATPTPGVGGAVGIGLVSYPGGNGGNGFFGGGGGGGGAGGGVHGAGANGADGTALAGGAGASSLDGQDGGAGGDPGMKGAVGSGNAGATGGAGVGNLGLVSRNIGVIRISW